MRMWPQKRPASGFSASYTVPSGYRKVGKSWAPILRVPFSTLLQNNLCNNQEKVMYTLRKQSLHWISFELIKAPQGGKRLGSGIVIPPMAVLLGPNNWWLNAFFLQIQRYPLDDVIFYGVWVWGACIMHIWNHLDKNWVHIYGENDGARLPWLQNYQMRQAHPWKLRSVLGTWDARPEICQRWLGLHC